MSVSLYTAAGVAGAGERTPGSSAPNGRALVPKPDEREQRRGEPARGHRAVDDAPRRHSRTREEQRHGEGALVEENAVLLLAVLAQHLAVITDRSDDPPAASRQSREEPPDLPVDVRDLARVAPRRRCALPVAGRQVRGVGIVVVHPHEPGTAGRKLRRPGEGRARDEGGVALRIALLPQPLGDHEVVVEVEPPRQTEAAVEDTRSDEGCRAVPALRENFGERRDLRGERPYAVVPHAVRRRLEAGEERAVGRERQRRGRQGSAEARPFFGQSVEVRRLRGSAFDTSDVVRAGRVERDQDDGGRAGGGGGGGGGEGKQQRRDQGWNYELRP